MRRNKCNDKKDVKAHRCIISACLLFHHCITAKQRLSFLSLSLSCLAVHASTYKRTHTHKHTHSLCLFLFPQLVLQHKHFAHSRTTSALCRHCTVRILLPARLHLFSSQNDEGDQSVSQPLTPSKSYSPGSGLRFDCCCFGLIFSRIGPRLSTGTWMQTTYRSWSGLGPAKTSNFCAI